MKKILISHFYNEEYLLPYWLNHHKDIFDEGIMIDYDSTDRSVDIIKKICPNWKIFKSKNKYFSALDIDKEVIEYENLIKDGDYRICLNTTEFLICKKDLFLQKPQNQYLIPAFIMVDSNQAIELDIKKKLIQQKTNGIHYNKMFSFKKARSLHNFNIIQYPIGRHFETYNTTNAVICWYGFSPFNENLIKRKLQIQNKIPKSDINKGWGHHHIVDKQNLEKQYNQFLQYSSDLKQEIEEILGENKMIETRPWGEFQILHEEEKCKIKKLVIKPGQKFSLQTHKKRSELWTILQGTGEVTLDDEISPTQAGMIYFIPAGVKHRLENMGTDDLVAIEVQTGSSFSEEDIVRYEDSYGRV